MVRPRKPRNTTDVSEDDFIEAAEKPQPADRNVEQRLADRAQGRYFQLLSYRGSEEQKALIDYAAAQEGKSIQKLLEGLILEPLEQKYGRDFDLDR